MTDSLFKIGKMLKKPLIGVLKKTAENRVEKESNIAVKKADDKIGNILRKRGAPKKTVASVASKNKNDLIR